MIAKRCTLPVLKSDIATDWGDVSNVQTHQVDSQLYSQQDIEAAIAVIETEFDKIIFLRIVK